MKDHKKNKPELSPKDNIIMVLKYLMCTAGVGIIQLVSFSILYGIGT